MKCISFVFLSLLIAALAFADDAAIKKYRNYTPQQIQKLPEKTLKNDVPMMYTMAAQRGLAEDFELLFAMQLNLLMYSGLHDYKAAVNAYQRDLGDSPTGVLTVWQIHNLEQRADMQKLSRVLFPEQFSDVKTEDFAHIRGTLTILDDRIAWPINHVQVECYKDQNYCQFNQLKINVPNKDSWSQNYHVMQDPTEYFTISRWSQDSIDAVPNETAGACRTTSLNLNFKTKEFYYITLNAGGDCEFMGVSLDKLTKPRISQIVDGSQIINEEYARIQKSAYDVLSSDFRKKVDKAISKEEKK